MTPARLGVARSGSRRLIPKPSAGERDSLSRFRVDGARAGSFGRNMCLSVAMAS